MDRNRTCCLSLCAALAVASGALAQEESPHLGYVYPAGGQQGMKFQVLLGGQHLAGAAWPGSRAPACRPRSWTTSGR